MAREDFGNHGRPSFSFVILAIYATILALAIPFSQSGAYLESSPFYGSIFGAAPIALLILLASTISTTVAFIYAKNSNSTYNSCLGILILSGAAFQILPTLKGYFLYGTADPSNHLGTIITILNSGTNPSLNFYPAMHIFGAIFVQTTGFPLYYLPALLGELLYGCYLLGSFALVPILFESSASRRICYIVIPSFALGSYLIPTYFAFALVPTILWLYLSRNKFWSIPFIVLVATLTISHPLVSLFLILAIFFWHIVSRRELFDSRLAMMAIFWIGWMGYSLTFSSTVTAVVTRLGFGPSTSSTNVQEFLSYSGPLNSIELVARQFLPLFVIVLLELVLIMKWKKAGGSLGILTMMLLLALILFPTPVLLKSLDFGTTRFLPYLQFAAIFTAGIFLAKGALPFSRQAVIIVVIAFFVLTSALISYSSWYTFEPSNQITRNQFVADNWLFGYTQNNSVIGGPLFQTSDAYNLVKGEPLSITSVGLAPNPYYPFQDLHLAAHFELTRRTANYVLVISGSSVDAYESIYANTSYNSTDFQRILSNSKLDLIYSSMDQSYLYSTSPSG